MTSKVLTWQYKWNEMCLLHWWSEHWWTRSVSSSLYPAHECHVSWNHTCGRCMHTHLCAVQDKSEVFWRIISIFIITMICCFFFCFVLQLLIFETIGHTVWLFSRSQISASKHAVLYNIFISTFILQPYFFIVVFYLSHFAFEIIFRPIAK